jgi:hypothetical protein
MDANGTADLNQVEQQTVSPLSADWELSISHASANALFAAFAIVDGSANSVADIVVNYVSANDAATKAAIKYALENATDASSNGLKKLMEDYVKEQVELDLSTSGLYNILEAEALINVNIPNAALGTSGGDAMAAVMSGAGAQDARNVVATQLPYDQYSGIQDGGNLDSAFAAGDKMVLNFTVESVLAITPLNEFKATGYTDSAGAAAQAAFNAAKKSRTINLTVTKLAA